MPCCQAGAAQLRGRLRRRGGGMGGKHRLVAGVAEAVVAGDENPAHRGAPAGEGGEGRPATPSLSGYSGADTAGSQRPMSRASRKPISTPTQSPLKVRATVISSGVRRWQHEFTIDTCPMIPTRANGTKTARRAEQVESSRVASKAGWPIRNSFVRGRTRKRSS